jgi:hypothetical protein
MLFASAPALHRVVEELFFGDAFALPALIGEFLHVGVPAIQPVKFRDPADYDKVAIDKHGPHKG